MAVWEVVRRVVGTQTVQVEASSLEEAKLAAMGDGGEIVEDFSWEEDYQPSTWEVECVEEDEEEEEEEDEEE